MFEKLVDLVKQIKKIAPNKKKCDFFSFDFLIAYLFAYSVFIFIDLSMWCEYNVNVMYIVYGMYVCVW